ncbi:MAG: hypothetical protein ABI333_26145 [bacterium]
MGDAEGCDEDCGNGELEPGETCDGENLGGQTCEGLGLGGGSLACGPGCLRYDVSGCDVQAECGDAAISYPEHCDGDNHGGQTCVSLGYYAGDLLCLPDCSDFDPSGCGGRCGDGVCDPAQGEGRTGCPEDCSRYVGISAGYLHSCAFTADGSAWCWGYGVSGQLGNGSTSDSSTPVKVVGLANTTTISAGKFHSCAATSDGSAFCWGLGGDGRLGNGSLSESPTPVPVTDLEDVVTVSAGNGHSCAVLMDGSTWCWGGGWNGELGDGTWMSSSTPVPVSDLTNAVAISVGGDDAWLEGGHSCAVTSDGTAWCWGGGSEGRLGTGIQTTSSGTPEPVTGLANVVDISAGLSHSCAVTSDGSAWCWGAGYLGQLGNGSTSISFTPVQASALTGAASITAGSSHSCSVTRDGAAWCWGNAAVGDGSTEGSATPAVSGMSGAVAVSAGNGHSCAIRSDGTAWCWGGGGHGRLGNGSTADSSVPVQVLPPP